MRRIIKVLNKILYDKNDYHKDPILKSEVETSEYLIQHTIEYEKRVLLKKIRYFLRYDKLLLFRILAKYITRLLIGTIFIGVFFYILAVIFKLDVNFTKIPRVEKMSTPIYILSTGNYIRDSIMLNDYKKNFGHTTTYIFYYKSDSTKNFNKWKEDLSGIESGGWVNPYEARREKSQYWGKYQMGESARKSIGFDKISWEEWKTVPDIQEASIKLWAKYLYKILENDINKFDGKFLNGWLVTESGIIAMAHNVGPESTKDFLYSYGKKVPKDGSGKDATRFLILGNYNLNLNGDN